jgi:hypothetical protein
VRVLGLVGRIVGERRHLGLCRVHGCAVPPPTCGIVGRQPAERLRSAVSPCGGIYLTAG